MEDGLACERAGIPFVLAAWGAPDLAEILSAVRPTFVANDHTDVLSFVLGDSA